MRNPLRVIALAAAAFALVGVHAPATAQQQKQQPQQKQQQPQQQQQQQQQQTQTQPPPKAYKPVAVKLPQPVNDPTFETFRKQLADIAQKKDKAALARLIAQNFFWIPEDQDAADKKKSPIDNLAKAMGLEGNNSEAGWGGLAGFCARNPADPMHDQHRPGA